MVRNSELSNTAPAACVSPSTLPGRDLHLLSLVTPSLRFPDTFDKFLLGPIPILPLNWFSYFTTICSLDQHSGRASRPSP